MTQRFLMVPTANLDVNNQPTTLSGAVLDDATITGLTNGTAYRAFALNVISDTFTPAAATNITVVGDVLTATSWNGSTNVERTLTPTASILENDIIVVIRGRQDNEAITALSGYTSHADLNAISAGGRLRVQWLRATSSPPASVVVPVEGAGTSPVTISVVVLRGVNTTTTFDVTSTTASATAYSIAMPAITPTTNGAYILCAAVINDRDVASTITYPANLNEINNAVGAGNGSNTNANTLAIGGHRQTTAGAFSPGTLTYTAGSVESINAITMAFRQA